MLSLLPYRDGFVASQGNWGAVSWQCRSCNGTEQRCALAVLPSYLSTGWVSGARRTVSMAQRGCRRNYVLAFQFFFSCVPPKWGLQGASHPLEPFPISMVPSQHGSLFLGISAGRVVLIVERKWLISVIHENFLAWYLLCFTR